MNILNFKKYNRAELFKNIDAIEITKFENQVITKYFNKIINTTKVSNRYEIFDIRNFMKNKIAQLESNFDISFYRFVMKRGTQQLTLLSDPVEINGVNYYKAFFIINSTDKSRKLSMNLGLYQDNTSMYLVFGVDNLSFTKRHITGITNQVEEVSKSIDGESFDEQINSIKSLVGEKVLLSNIREIIVDKEQKINHRKFDAFKNQIRYSGIKWGREELNTLATESEKLQIDAKNDILVDAYWAFTNYMMLFRNQDSYIVKKETERIIKITQCFIRNEKIGQLLDLIVE